MPMKPPRICACGKVIAAGALCECGAAARRARKARFDAKRPTSSQRGYTGAWDKAKAGFLAKHPFCRFCGAASDTVDHIRPHRGDTDVFWDRSNWQALCGPCHNSTKQRQERIAKR
jgi:5-methylcytosine-specific restriction protein A